MEYIHTTEAVNQWELKTEKERDVDENWISYLNRTLTLPSEAKYTAIDLFAGCGGLSLGFECAGIRTIGFEKVSDCCATYANNLGSKCNQIDIEESTEYPEMDILIGGPPCQPFSRIGKQLGEADQRNGFPAFISAVRRYRPDIWIFENVKGLSESMPEYYQSVIDELESFGYEVESHIVRMVKYGVPQTRERMVVVGHHGGYVFPKEQDRKVTAGEALDRLAYEVPADAMFLTKSQDEYIAKYEKASKCVNPRDLHLDRPARTLTCRNLAGCTSDMQRIKLPDGRRRRLTVREAARLQSFPDWYQFYGTMESQFTQIGNAVPPLFAYQLGRSVVEYMDMRRGDAK